MRLDLPATQLAISQKPVARARAPELGQLHQPLGLAIPNNTNQPRTETPKVTVRERADPKFSINFQSSIRGDLYQLDWLIKVWLHQSGSVRG